MRLQLCSAFIVLICSLYIAFNLDSLDAGTAGLALSYAISSTVVCQAATAAFTQLEVGMNSVERISNYAELEPEGAENNKIREADRDTQSLPLPETTLTTFCAHATVRAMQPGGGGWS